VLLADRPPVAPKAGVYVLPARRRLQQNRPWKVVTVRYGRDEDRDAAEDRHFAAHPEDRDANVVIFHALRR
jgi:hypothetical protein